MNIFYLLLALVAGAGMSVQTAINSRLSFGIGDQPLVASLVSFIVGTVCLLIVTLFQSDWSNVFAHAGQQPWWRWLGGALGAVFVFTIVFLAPKMGISNVVFLLIIGQLAAGMVIDGYGLIQMPVRSIHWWKFAGMGVMLIGLALFMFGDKWFKQ
ncbi:DMT family transporter [Neisseria animaloris]|uniref:DMT family transporter n=1 Tax=Neisseria animaloris TaxID=326522 RepID=UPI000D361E09|nr:DMT family transporter [Neisseria animaloris]